MADAQAAAVLVGRGSAVVIVAATLWVLVSPVVLDQLFNRFTPLRQEPLRGEVLQLARTPACR